MSVRTYPVPDGLEGQRLDQALSRMLGISRTRAAELVDQALVTLDGELVPKSARVLADQTVTVEDPEAAPAARPDPDRPGAFLPNGAAAKGGLNRAVLDAAFGEIRRQLTYKTSWYGSTLQVAPRFYPSSKTCSACGAVKAKLRLAERVFSCPACGHAEDRDINAAKNLAARSWTDDACGKRESQNAGRAGPRLTATGRQ